MSTPAPSEASPLPPKPLAEELPPDFWGDDPSLPEVPQTARNAEERFDETFSAPPQTRPKAPTSAAANLTVERLEADPCFALLQRLFPGYISDFQPARAPATGSSDPLEDAAETPETVDLEEGLDADEGDDEV